MSANLRAGQKLTASVLNAAIDRNEPLYAEKTADQSVTSSTVLVNCTSLSAPVAANCSYFFNVYLEFSAATAGDLNIDFTGPAGHTMRWVGHSVISTAAATSGDLIMQRRIEGDTWDFAGAGASRAVARPNGRLVIGGTAGTFQLRFAQLVSSGTATTIHAGSFLVLQRVA